MGVTICHLNGTIDEEKDNYKNHSPKEVIAILTTGGGGGTGTPC